MNVQYTIERLQRTQTHLKQLTQFTGAWHRPAPTRQTRPKPYIAFSCGIYGSVCKMPHHISGLRGTESLLWGVVIRPGR